LGGAIAIQQRTSKQSLLPAQAARNDDAARWHGFSRGRQAAKIAKIAKSSWRRSTPECTSEH
jgi:hypothetical protein